MDHSKPLAVALEALLEHDGPHTRRRAWDTLLAFKAANDSVGTGKPPAKPVAALAATSPPARPAPDGLPLPPPGMCNYHGRPLVVTEIKETSVRFACAVAGCKTFSLVARGLAP